jgi:hypothetical protein
MYFNKLTGCYFFEHIPENRVTVYLRGDPEKVPVFADAADSVICQYGTVSQRGGNPAAVNMESYYSKNDF